MENPDHAKGGQAVSVNCVPVVLTSDELAADLEAGNLRPTAGFFCGESDGSELEDDLAFLAKAREAIAKGLTVYYDSWW